jgi:hypothetical protein
MSQTKIDVNYASIDEVMAIAKNVWNHVKTKEKRTESECTQMVSDIYKLFPDFARTFPVMVEHMVCENKFYKNEFAKYLEYYSLKTKSDAKRSEDDFLVIQTEYLVFVHKSLNKHLSTAEIGRFRQFHLESMKRAAKENKERIERLSKAAELEDKEELEKVRAKLIEKLMSMKIKQTDEEVYTGENGEHVSE